MLAYKNHDRADYLKQFSPGHFHLTFVLGQNGLNEDEIHILNVS